LHRNKFYPKAALQAAPASNLPSGPHKSFWQGLLDVTGRRSLPDGILCGFKQQEETLTQKNSPEFLNEGKGKNLVMC